MELINYSSRGFFLLLIIFPIVIKSYSYDENLPDCPLPGDDPTYYPYPGDCKKYILCYLGVRHEYTCPLETWWNPGVSDCDVPGDYCNNDSQTTLPTTISTTPTTTTYTDPPTTTTPTTTTSTDPPTTTAPTTTTSTDPPTTTTPTTTTSTDPPTTTAPTTTTSTDLPTTTTPTTTTSAPEPIDPRCADNNTDFWHHPNDCKKYIECYGGKSYEMHCPPDLYFSEAHRKCVNIDESECCDNPNTADTCFGF